jgi:hypothetical protein
MILVHSGNWYAQSFLIFFCWYSEKKKGLSFISNRQRRKEGTFCASELAGIEPTPPAPEEQGIILGMRAIRQLG